MQDAIDSWTVAILLVGLLVPFFSGMITAASLRLFGVALDSMGRHLQASDYINEDAFDRCVAMLEAGFFTLSWWPFAAYALIVRREKYRAMFERKITHPGIPVLFGLIGLTLPAIWLWFDAFLMPDINLTALGVTTVGALFLAPGAAIGWFLGWVIASATSRDSAA